ncbi:hypothetical protein H8E77_11500 [bacterium]|nr:hypothetical protein [bacterium]
MPMKVADEFKNNYDFEHALEWYEQVIQNFSDTLEAGNASLKTFEMNRVKLYLPKFMPIVRFKKVKSGIRVYDNSEKARAYWEKRAYTNSLSSIYSIQIVGLRRSTTANQLSCDVRP